MNPFMLLIGPAVSVLMFVVKMVVAATITISNQFAMLPRDGGPAGTAVLATATAGGPDQLMVRLHSGEMFVGTFDRSTETLELTSNSGRTMRCLFEHASAPAGVCEAGDQTFDLLL